MPKQTRFQVDSRLASLLSQEYSSTEKALKELMDNAWDADAGRIFISLPAPMSSESIVISDDGSGMTAEEYAVARPIHQLPNRDGSWCA
jgi:HSP90 family molecular chaperone